MIKITKRVEYALMALKYISSQSSDQLSTARVVCEQLAIPFDTTSKVMQTMNQQNLLQSSKGVNGGYTLQRSLSEISYLELVEMIEGKSFIMDCQDGPCDLIGSCNITFPIQRLNEYLTGIFSQLSLDDLLNQKPLIRQTKNLDEMNV